MGSRRWTLAAPHGILLCSEALCVERGCAAVSATPYVTAWLPRLIRSGIIGGRPDAERDARDERKDEAVAGTLVLELDDEAVTTLARVGAKQTYAQWPSQLKGVVPDSIRVHMEDGNRMEVAATGLPTGIPSVILQPEVAPGGKLDLHLSAGRGGLSALINIAAPFLSNFVSGLLDDQIAALRQNLATQGLQLQITGVRARRSVLAVTAQVVVARP
jgi:hypothetical protein